ncbi:MAG: ABC transporter permease, partial [Parapedobacter sp.]
MSKIVKYVIADLLRSRAIMVYALVLLVLSISVFSIEDNADKGVVSLL